VFLASTKHHNTPQQATMDEVQKLYQIHKTVIQMLLDRNYLVTQQEQELTREEFRAKFAESAS
jgi:hypothetical protein